MSAEIKHVFSVDAESYGLYGDAFAVGVSVRHLLTNIELDTFFAWHELELVRGFDPTSDDAKWLTNNAPLFTAAVHGKPKDSPKALREAFWGFFQKWKDRGVVVVADWRARGGVALSPVRSGRTGEDLERPVPPTRRGHTAPGQRHGADREG